MALDTWTFVTETPETTLPIGDYKYREGRQSDTGGVGENPGTVRVFLVDWGMLPEFLDDLIGYAEPPTSSGGNLKRTIPEEHPTLSYFYATDATFKPVGVGTVSPGGSKSNWPVAEVTVSYKPLPFAVYADGDITNELDRFVSRSYQSKAEYLQANNVGMQYVTRTESKSIQFTPGVLVPSVIAQYVWHDLPAPSSTDDDPTAEFRPPVFQTYTQMIGKSNSYEFDGHPPRTLVLLDVQSQIKMPRVTDGLYLYDLIYTFDIRNHGTPGVGGDAARGVDYVYDLANDRWDLITTTGDTSGKRLFQADNFDKLFQWTDGEAS